jgi:hypothetical protein
MKIDNTNTIKKQILTGIELAFNKLLKIKIKDDAEFIFSKNGKIVKIKARDLVSKP